MANYIKSKSDFKSKEDTTNNKKKYCVIPGKDTSLL